MARKRKTKEMLITGVVCGSLFCVLFVLMINFAGFMPTMVAAMIPVGALGDRFKKKYRLSSHELASSVALMAVFIVTSVLVVFMR